MYRSVFIIGLFLVLYTIIGFMIPHDALSLTFLLPDGVVAIIGLIFGVILINFAVTGFFRHPGLKRILGFAGLLALAAAVTGLIDPTYFGLIKDAVRPPDLLIFLQTGIGMSIAALEYDRPSFQVEVGIPYRDYLRYILVRPKLLTYSYEKRAKLVVGAMTATSMR